MKRIRQYANFAMSNWRKFKAKVATVQIKL